jgi:hypothetical protein
MEDDGRIVVHGAEPLDRSRLATLFRALLVVPHCVVLSIWTLWIVPVLFAGWLAALAAGRVPRRLHRWLAAYLRYQGQVTAWFDLLSSRYPDPQRTLEHPFRLEVADPRRQRRLLTLLRAPLAVPAMVLASVFGVILFGVSIGAWLVSLVLGRTTAGLQELGTFCLRYQLEVQAYVLLLTPAYPKLAPPGARPESG